jgi:hypothetical protein
MYFFFLRICREDDCYCSDDGKDNASEITKTKNLMEDKWCDQCIAQNGNSPQRGYYRCRSKSVCNTSAKVLQGEKHAMKTSPQGTKASGGGRRGVGGRVNTRDEIAGFANSHEDKSCPPKLALQVQPLILLLIFVIVLWMRCPVRC